MVDWQRSSELTSICNHRVSLPFRIQQKNFYCMCIVYFEAETDCSFFCRWCKTSLRSWTTYRSKKMFNALQTIFDHWKIKSILTFPSNRMKHSLILIPNQYISNWGSNIWTTWWAGIAHHLTTWFVKSNRFAWSGETVAKCVIYLLCQ